MHHPKIIVLILSYNGKELLEDSVSSYLANNYPNFEVVVVDNGSVDNTKSYVEQTFPVAKVIRTNKNLGYSGGFNFGLKYAFGEGQADYVLITNNDVKADTSVIRSLVDVARTNDSIGFVTGKVYYFDSPDTLQTVGKYEDPVKWNGEHIGNREKDTGQYDSITERHFIDDVFMLVSKKLYIEIGAYDTTFFFQSEEYDWQARAKQRGYKIMYTPYAKIWHKESMTIGKQSAFKAFYDHRNPMLVLLIHQSPDYFRRYFWTHLRKTVKGVLVSCKQGKFDVAVNKWKGLVSGISWGLREKKFTRQHFFNSSKTKIKKPVTNLQTATHE